MKRVINFWSMMGAISVALFVTTELVITAAAAVWAFAGLLALDMVATTTLGVLVAVASLYVIVRITFMAFEAETDPENN